VRTKELTNIRAPGKDENIRLSPPRLVCPLLIYEDMTRHLHFLCIRYIHTILQDLIDNHQRPIFNEEHMAVLALGFQSRGQIPLD
jgi:hypothetical protein